MLLNWTWQEQKTTSNSDRKLTINNMNSVQSYSGCVCTESAYDEMHLLLHSSSSQLLRHQVILTSGHWVCVCACLCYVCARWSSSSPCFPMWYLAKSFLVTSPTTCQKQMTTIINQDSKKQKGVNWVTYLVLVVCNYQVPETQGSEQLEYPRERSVLQTSQRFLLQYWWPTDTLQLIASMEWFLTCGTV